MYGSSFTDPAFAEESYAEPPNLFSRLNVCFGSKADAASLVAKRTLRVVCLRLRGAKSYGCGPAQLSVPSVASGSLNQVSSLAPAFCELHVPFVGCGIGIGQLCHAMMVVGLRLPPTGRIDHLG